MGEQNDNCQSDLDCQNQGNADGKLQMQRLVPDGIHTEKAPDASAQNSGTEECPFRNAPQFFSGAALVLQHKEKPSCID